MSFRILNENMEVFFLNDFHLFLLNYISTFSFLFLWDLFFTCLSVVYMGLDETHHQNLTYGIFFHDVDFVRTTFITFKVVIGD